MYVDCDGFSFVGERFRLISGGNGAVVMVLKQNEKGESYVLDYMTPIPGGGLAESIKQMFPFQYVPQIQEYMRSNPLGKDIERQAKEWLKGQGKSEELFEWHT